LGAVRERLSSFSSELLRISAKKWGGRYESTS
jgi:hypothetical protein